ncbi:sensor histidine kinase [Pseudogemmobacter humi]|uniref:histidine kinase n=1 Tax=Pseudogemmobacter humi TaxID=2483812 RepID=A0A3P5XGF8_9RHOB|nr:ATP-binding protein [Pseudogemmobacter humi]VDC33875.1 Sensor protein QseC [Pseudogemmobacter humi]
MRPARARGGDWSIRRRLSRRVLLLVMASWAVTIGLATLFLDHEINEMLDEELQSLAETTVLYLDATPGPAISRAVGIDPGNGERVLRILPQGAPEPDAPWPGLTADGFHHVAGWRILRRTAEGTVIEAAHKDSWRREEMFEAASAFLILILPMGALLIWGLGVSFRRGFAPLDALSDSLRQRDPQDLTPLERSGLPRELQPLAQGLNGYITGIGNLRRAERHFIANASHELRTPVAAIRAQLDLSRDEAARAALPLLDSLTRRVERLLQLSRSEAGLGLGREASDLVQIIRLLVQEAGFRAPHPIRFDDGDIEQMNVAADPDALAIVLRNLLENALEHGSGPVLIRLRPGQLVIRNPAEGGAFHDLPFTKRTGSAGMGLGLTIVDQLTTAMGITVTKAHRDGIASVTLGLPPRADH